MRHSQFADADIQVAESYIIEFVQITEELE
jgi:hypothetical protein